MFDHNPVTKIQVLSTSAKKISRQLKKFKIYLRKNSANTGRNLLTNATANPTGNMLVSLLNTLSARTDSSQSQQ